MNTIEKITGIFADIDSSRYSTYVMITIFIAMVLASKYYRHKALTKYSKTRQQREAQNPKPQKQWICAEPTGIVLSQIGKRKWFCIPEDKNLMSAVVWGGTGSGKTTWIACVIMQMIREQQDVKNGDADKGECTYAMIADMKGEIHQMYMPEGSYYLIEPGNRSESVGWDPYARLQEQNHPSDDLKIEVFSGIARSFIPSAGERNSFFVDNARAILSGALSWGYERGMGLVDVIYSLLTNNIQDEIKKMCDEARDDELCMLYLGKFKGKTSEGFEDACSTCLQKLSCFSLQEVVWTLRDCPEKIGPAQLRENNIVISVKDNELTETQWSPIVRLMYEQTMQYLTSSLPQKGQPRACLLIDEAYAVGGGKGGQIPSLEKWLSIARGYGAYAILCYQGQSQMEQQYEQTGCRIILDNCRVKIILELSDKQSAETAVSWCGTYHERMQSVSADKTMHSNISWQVKNIFEPSDFMTLTQRKKVVVVLPAGFVQLPKLQWFNNKYFNTLQEEISEQDDKL